MKVLRGFLISLWITLLITSTVSAAPPDPTLLGHHTVQRGETLFCIARAYAVDPWAIAAQNRMIEVSRIHAGLILQIPYAPRTLPPGPICTRQFGGGIILPQPAPAPTCTCTRRHLITTGDTLTAISLRYGVNLWTVATCNRLQNPNTIRIGDTLCIP